MSALPDDRFGPRVLEPDAWPLIYADDQVQAGPVPDLLADLVRPLGPPHPGAAVGEVNEEPRHLIVDGHPLDPTGGLAGVLRDLVAAGLTPAHAANALVLLKQDGYQAARDYALRHIPITEGGDA